MTAVKTTDVEGVAMPSAATRMGAVATPSAVIHEVLAAMPSDVGNPLTAVAMPSGVQTVARAPPSVALSRLRASVRGPMPV